MYVVFPMVLFITGCYKENPESVDLAEEVFNFMVTDSQRILINESRGLQYEITDPLPILQFADNEYAIDRFEIRGDNTLNFTRKGFGVNMKDKVPIYNTRDKKVKKYEEFKLLAMVYDYTYIENSTATGMFTEVGLWPVYSFFTEVRLNNRTQGLYHFIEDPFEYFIEQENSSCVLRRGYEHHIKSISVNPANNSGEDYYMARFKKIYHSLPDYSGKQRYDTLSAYMDMEQYFKKLSIDLLLKNGDYTDEVIFYTKIMNGNEVFGVFPWDYDDIFADEPHEIGNDWAVGTIFGSRVYNSMDDVHDDVGFRLMFSIEDDLDYAIAKDEYVYQEYLKTLRNVIEKIDISTIDKIFDNTIYKVGPFYDNDSIIAQSRFDVDKTDYDLFAANIAQQKQMLKERRNRILEELDIQQKKQR